MDRDASCQFANARTADPAGISDLRGPPDGWSSLRFVKSDWREFFSHWLDDAVRDPAAHRFDAIVPSPLMPHLLFDWLAERARSASRRALPLFMPGEIAGVPWQKEGGDGTRYASFATWMCPINCVEPAKCPHTKGPRDWSLHDTLRQGAGGDAIGLLRVTHRAFGVGMIDVADVVDAHAGMLRALREGHRFRVATASHCHGAIAGIGLA